MIVVENPIGKVTVETANSLCSLSDDELSPAALAARVVLAECAHALMLQGRWLGAVPVARDP